MGARTPGCARQLKTLLLSSLLARGDGLAVPPAAVGVIRASVVRVCTNKSCRKDGAADTLALFRLLVSTAAPPPLGADPPAVAQAAFAAAHVQACGCLGQCGKGPNVALCDGAVEQCELFHGVHTPGSASSLLVSGGMAVAEAAAGAALKRAYAMRAMRETRFTEARDLLTSALNEAGAMRLGAAHLLSELLELRADVADECRDWEAAEADRAQAGRLRAAVPPAAVGV